MKIFKHNHFIMLIFFWASIGWTDSPHPHGIVIDGTIGSKQFKKLDGPDYQILAEHGEIKGNNLFHSFQTFNVHNNEQATFYGPDNIQNIISRVTGDTHSWIDGSIQSIIPDADFFLFNPNGVFFGPNVSLDVQGSFHVSTCDYIGFSDQAKFQTNTKNPIFTSAPPISFGFIDNNFTQIHIQGKGKTVPQAEYDLWPSLEVKNGQTISLIAGDIEIIDGTIDSVRDFPIGTIVADNGRVNIASVASTGEVIIQTDGLDVSYFEKMGNITLSNHSIISASSGQISIYGDHFKMNTSYINAGQYTSEDKTVKGFAGGRINIHVKQLSILDGSGIYIETYSSENSGDISIHAESIHLKGSSNKGVSKISTSSISIDIKDSIEIKNKSDISITQGQTFGNAGNINIFTGNLFLSEGASIYANALSSGNGGKISINATDTVIIRGNLLDICGVMAISLSDYEDGGHAGDIEIYAKDLIVQNGGKIKNSTGGTADSGQIDIKVAENLVIKSVDQKVDIENPVYERISGIFSTSHSEIEHEGKAGDAGSIHLSGKSLIMKQNSNINVSTNSTGNGGCINLDFETIEMDHSAFILSVSGADGDSGHIFLKSEKFVSVDNLSIIGAQSLGKGQPGAILIDTPKLTIDNHAIVSATSIDPDNTTKGYGVIIGQDISIDEIAGEFGVKHECDHISIKGKSEISTESYGKGEAGIIYMKSQVIELDEQSKVSSSSMKHGDSGHSGEIYLHSKVISLNHGSIITTENAGKGDAGIIKMISDNLTLDNLSRIHSVNTYGTEGGASGKILVCGGIEDISSIDEFTILPGIQVRIDNHSGLSTSSLSEGGPGSIIVRAQDIVMSNSAFISSETKYMGFSKNHGQISIRGEKVHLSSKSKISTHTEGESNAGGISLEISELALSEKSYISNAGIRSDRKGAGGLIMIAKTITHVDDFLFGFIEIQNELEIANIFRIKETATSISMNDAAYITTSSAGEGHAGAIIIGSQHVLLSDNSRISSESTSTTGGGSAGLIELENLKNLSLTQDSKITTQAVNTSVPDTIIPGCLEQDRLNGMISITATGNINLLDGRISSSVLGGLGNGGNLSILSKNTILNKSQIIANAYEGNGGNIYIKADNLIQSSESVISASSQLGIDGNIEIDAFTENFDQQIISMADNFLDGSKWIQTPCELRDNMNDSHFIINFKKVRPRTFADWQPGHFALRSH